MNTHATVPVTMTMTYEDTQGWGLDATLKEFRAHAERQANIQAGKLVALAKQHGFTLVVTSIGSPIVHLGN